MAHKHLTPKQTVHKYCRYCVGSKFAADVMVCGGDMVLATGKACPFYPYRMGNKRLSVRVFRQFCLECMGGRADYVRECSTRDCPIHGYRMGKNPVLQGVRKPPKRAVMG